MNTNATTQNENTTIETPVKRGRGRPKGSKNKKVKENINIQSEVVVDTQYEQQDTPSTEAVPTKRGRGRPKGVKNRKKSEVFREMLERSKTENKKSKEIDALSECLEGIYFDEEYQRTTFNDRLYRVKKAVNQKAGVELLEKISNKCRPEEVAMISNSKIALRIAANLENKKDLEAYCGMLSFKEKDLHEVSGKANHFSNLPLVMAFGVWSRHLIEMSKVGNSVNQSDFSLAKKMQDEFSNENSFLRGVSLAERLWSESLVG